MSNKKEKLFLQAQVYIGTNPHRTLKAPTTEGIENILDNKKNTQLLTFNPTLVCSLRKN